MSAGEAGANVVRGGKARVPLQPFDPKVEAGPFFPQIFKRIIGRAVINYNDFEVCRALSAQSFQTARQMRGAIPT